MDLLKQTLKLAQRTSLAKADICARADIKIRWYNLLLAGEIPDPGVRKIQRLYNVLDKHDKRKRARSVADKNNRSVHA